MPDDEKNLWIDSMNVKLAALWNKECFELVKVSAAKGHQITPLTWAFKFKSKPDGTYSSHRLGYYTHAPYTDCQLQSSYNSHRLP